MKTSFMTFSTPDLGLRDALELARRLGYDGIEPRVMAGHLHGIELDMAPADRASARAMAADIGVAYACVATSCRYADPADRAAQVDDTRRAIDLAADIGAPTIRVFGGGLPPGMGRADAVAQVAAALRAVAEQAAQRGVAVCMETHDSWCDPADVARVMQRVDHASVGVNWDIMHPVRAAHATMDSAYSALGRWVRHTHVHDGAAGDALRHVPIGDGAIDHGRAIELLARSGYQGYLSGEWIDWQPALDHLPRELARLKALIAAAP